MSESPENNGPALHPAAPNPVAADARRELPWTGERLVPSARGDFVAEHLHRYALATELARDADVLDVACGEGYGAAFLASTARSVIGVDNDPDTVAHAKRKYGAANVMFTQGLAEKIPLPNRSVDLVVSFETLEHLDDHEGMMREVCRVLRPKGRLLISTPDTKPYQAVSGRTNPFHVRELDRPGFEALLSRHFKHQAIGVQKSISGSWFVPFKPNAAPVAEYAGGFTRLERNEPGTEAPYLLALASDAPLPPLPASFYNAAQEIAAHYDTMVSEHRDSRAALVRIESEFAERTEWARSLEADIAEGRGEIARLHDEGVELKNWARTLEGELRKTRELVIERTKLAEKQTFWAQSLEKELREAEQHFNRAAAELAERTTWAQSLQGDLDRERLTAAAREQELEGDLERARQITAERERELGEKTAWARSLEDDVSAARDVVAERDHLLAERDAWIQALESDLTATRSEVARLQIVHQAAITWGRSLEEQVAVGKKDFTRLNEEFADRTRWALSLDAELSATKSDRDRVAGEAAEVGRELHEVAGACGKLATVLADVAPGARGAEVVERGLRRIADLRLEVACKEALLRGARAEGRGAELNHLAAQAESRRLAQCLRDAQIHLDHLLGQTDTLHDSLRSHQSARTVEEELHRQTERELNLRTLEARQASAALSGYERVFACRLFHRWFGRGVPSPGNAT